MKIIITFLLTVLFQFAFSQSSYVYKRNLATGELEVFESQGGLPTGSALYKIKKNVYGYLELESINASTNPFTRRPDYSAYSNYNSYKLPAKEIFETLETLNKKNEYDYISSNPSLYTNNNASQLIQETQTFMQNRTKIATSYLNFYNSNVDFPKKLKDGWYDAITIKKVEVNEASRKLGFTDGNEFSLAICKIENNKVTEYYENINIADIKTGFVFQKVKLDVISGVNNCKSTFRASNDNVYSSIYFLDNILDSTKQISNPEFSFYTVYTANNFKANNLTLTFQIGRNKTITRDEIVNFKGGPYVLTVFKPNPNTSDCKNSEITFAFKKSTDKFSFGIVRIGDSAIWTINDLTFSPGACNSTILNEQ